MAVLLLADVIAGGALNMDATARAVTAAKALGDVTVLVAGPSSAAVMAATLEGVTKVLLAEGDHPSAESVATLVAGLSGFSHIVAPSTAATRNVLPRAAALLDVMIIPDVTDIWDEATFVRAAYAGNAVQTVRSADPVKVLTVRTTAFTAATTGGTAGVEAVILADAGLSVWVEDHIATSDRPELASAGIVVAGGRGIGSEENFRILEALADKMGAAVGASRAAVDAGYAPNDWQVGQTGKVVAPDLYIAVGVSGAIQHLAGMKDSKVIVAINKDEDAPIFQIADYGLVGDLFTLIPELTEKV